MLRSAITVMAAALVLAFAGAAGAATTPTGWKETAKIHGKAALEFTVDSITTLKTSWSAKVSLRNVSQVTVSIGNGFGIALYGDAKTTDAAKAALGHASWFKPGRPPAKLAPGASWRGEIGGDGGPVAGTYARIVFGSFDGLPGQPRFYWITDHSEIVHKPVAAVGAV